MHRQKTGGLIHGETTIRSCLDVEMGDASVFFVEVKKIARIGWVGSVQKMMILFTSADDLHVHPSVFGFGCYAKPLN